MSALWVARHAPVAVSGVCYGQSDVPVEVDHGAGATRLAAQWAELSAVAYKKITRIWTSPWERTRGLAEALGKCLSVPVDADARLSEIAFGEWEGRSYAEIEANDGDRFRAWMADWERLAPPGGESVPALVARLDSWRRELGASPAIAVSHAGPIRSLRALARGVSYAAVASEAVSWLKLEAIARPVPRGAR